MKQFFDKIRVYSIELALVMWELFIGVTLLLPESIIETYLWRNHEQTLGLMFVLTGSVGLLGIFWEGENIDTEWLLIRISLVVSVFTWLSYGLLLGWSGFILAIISLVLFLRLMSREKDVRNEIES